MSRAPAWAQIIIALAATYAVAALIVPSLTERRYKRQFEALARELGGSVSYPKDQSATFAVDVAERRFNVRHDYKGSSAKSSGATYRGPRGHVLATGTPLRAHRWSMHQVEIGRLNKIRHAISGATRMNSGDTAFDECFRVLQDGIPVRERWLDAPTREALVQLFDRLPAQAVVWVHGGELLVLSPTPWANSDGGRMHQQLAHQAALASALERTAGGSY